MEKFGAVLRNPLFMIILGVTVWFVMNNSKFTKSVDLTREEHAKIIEELADLREDILELRYEFVK